jgi:GMP synthase (glutamine-hydrolysing)
MTQKPRFLVLQHADCEPPAAFGDELIARDYELVRVALDLGEDLPPWYSFAGVIAMGGPMGTYEIDRFPWLVEEIRFIAEVVEAGVPFWGVCLGAQLLAAAAGGTVAPGPEPEVGVMSVQLTDEAASDPVFDIAPEQIETLQWHGDTYTLPPGAIQLARSATIPQQAFRVGSAYGLQFHLEATADMVAEWGTLFAYSQSLERVHGPGALAALLRDVASVEEEARTLARQLFGRWLDLFVQPEPELTAYA